MNSTKCATVSRVLLRSARADVILTSRKTITLSRYPYLKPGDLLRFSPGIQSFHTIHKIFKDRATHRPTSVLLFPPYVRTELIHVPPHVLRITFKERTTPTEWRAAKNLEQFHYRGKGFNRIVGRRIVLIAECPAFGVVAYGVLSATVGMAKPRFGLFHTNFTDQMRSGLINQIARIPRIVVHPEFRGMGLGVLMARHLVRYARRYWDINGYKPIMVEVIAKMTEYHKFFERAGFTRLGSTEGYEEGIIPQYGNGSWEKRNFEKFDFMGNQGAKPYLMRPLTGGVARRLHRVLNSRRASLGLAHVPRPSARSIRFEGVSISYRVRNGHTRRSRIVRDAFGVDAGQLDSVVVQGLDLNLRPGDVALVTGASGSGKSTLLKPLCRPPNWVRSRMRLRGRIVGEAWRAVAELTTAFRSNRPLVEQVCVGKDVRYAIELLNSVGLAEAHLYLKAPNRISDGQRYRFAVAKLCDSGKPIWVADEFSSTLSPEMAAVVAKGLRRRAKGHGATVILAAPHIEHFAASLVPNKLIRLSWGGRAMIHGVRTEWSETEKEVELLVENESSTDLHNLTLDLLDLRGPIRTVKRQKLLVRGGEWRVSVKKHPLRQAVALRVYCREGVGDIAYLEQRR